MHRRVSVVIPTYNGAGFITSTLESVFAQTEPPDEIVVVDDCSSDKTPAIVQSIAPRSPIRLRFITLPKNSGGPARPLNVGIREAAGEVIVLLDQDDLMRPQRIELQIRTLTALPACTIVIGRFAIIGYEEEDLTAMWPVSQFQELEHHIDRQKHYSKVESEIAFKPLLVRNYAGSCSNFCFTKESWEKIGKFDETVRTCNDLDFMLRATLAGPIGVVNDNLFDYRCRESSLLRRDLGKSQLEATMVRLKAASRKPEWAAEELEALRYSALSLATVSLREGNWRSLGTMAETLALYKGGLVLRRTISNKARNFLKALHQ